MTEEQAKTEAATAAPRKALVQTFTGRVVSDKMDKTVTVLVERRVKHPLYGKIVMQSREVPRARRDQRVQGGDLVEIAATRKLSKTKAFWRVARCWRRRRRSEALGRTSNPARMRFALPGMRLPISDVRHHALVAAMRRGLHPGRRRDPGPRAGSKTGRRRSNGQRRSDVSADGGLSWREGSNDPDAVGAGRRRQHRRAFGDVYQGARRQQAPLRAHRRRDQGVASRTPRRAVA